jgi:leucyl aminopeptidase (aminopeptidase T)
MSGRGRTPAPDVARAADVLVRDYMAVGAGESVLITADLATDPELAQALVTAAHPADARPSVLTIPRLPYQGHAHRRQQRGGRTRRGAAPPGEARREARPEGLR